MTLYLGLMSGTSMDGIDAALLQIDDAGMRLLSAVFREWPAPLQRRLRCLAEDYEHIGLVELGQLDTSAAREFAQAAEQLLHANELAPAAVRAVGSHGQTVLHQPRGEAPFTLQIGDPNIIAERLGIDVVADSWARRHLQHAFDANGGWAATGRVQTELLSRLLSEPYFSREPPKSTGRDTFSDEWLDRALAGLSLVAADVQATLSELTALTIADCLQAGTGTDPTRVLICGGGAFNANLMDRLARALPRSRVETTAAFGIAPQHVEAAGFAWLAHRYVSGLPGNLPAVTGARHLVPLGALYRGSL
jgi:1,6-anhydro-N-acetylmuramate kinase